MFGKFPVLLCGELKELTMLPKGQLSLNVSW